MPPNVDACATLLHSSWEGSLVDRSLWLGAQTSGFRVRKDFA